MYRKFVIFRWYTFSKMDRKRDIQWLGLWCSMPLLIIFQLYQFYCWRKPEKTTEILSASHRQTLSHNAASSTPCLNGVRTHKISGGEIFIICH